MKTSHRSKVSRRGRSGAAYGDEAVMLLAGGGEVVVRYSGCDHRGFDDGRTVRRLGPATARIFLTGPNTLFAGASPALLPGE